MNVTDRIDDLRQREDYKDAVEAAEKSLYMGIPMVHLGREDLLAIIWMELEKQNNARLRVRGDLG